MCCVLRPVKGIEPGESRSLQEIHPLSVGFLALFWLGQTYNLDARLAPCLRSLPGANNILSRLLTRRPRAPDGARLSRRSRKQTYCPAFLAPRVVLISPCPRTSEKNGNSRLFLRATPWCSTHVHGAQNTPSCSPFPASPFTRSWGSTRAKRAEKRTAPATCSAPPRLCIDSVALAREQRAGRPLFLDPVQLSGRASAS